MNTEELSKEADLDRLAAAIDLLAGFADVPHDVAVAVDASCPHCAYDCMDLPTRVENGKWRCQRREHVYPVVQQHWLAAIQEVRDDRRQKRQQEQEQSDLVAPIQRAEKAEAELARLTEERNAARDLARSLEGYRDRFVSVERELARLTAPRPIAEAPKDGTWLLGLWPESNEWPPIVMRWTGKEWQREDPADRDEGYRPTHWLPLPAPRTPEPPARPALRVIEGGKTEAPANDRGEGAKYDSSLNVVEIAKRIRADIKAAITAGTIPAIKTSVRISRYSMGRSIDVTITETPFEVLNPAWTEACKAGACVWDLDGIGKFTAEGRSDARFRCNQGYSRCLQLRPQRQHDRLLRCELRRQRLLRLETHELEPALRR